MVIIQISFTVIFYVFESSIWCKHPQHFFVPSAFWYFCEFVGNQLTPPTQTKPPQLFDFWSNGISSQQQLIIKCFVIIQISFTVIFYVFENPIWWKHPMHFFDPSAFWYFCEFVGNQLTPPTQTKSHQLFDFWSNDILSQQHFTKSSFVKNANLFHSNLLHF